MCFAACECSCITHEREVVQANIEEETETCVDFLRHTFGNHFVSIAQHQFFEEICRVGDGHFAHFRNTLVVNGDCQRSGFETRSFASRTRHFAHVGFILLARPVAFRSFMTTLDPRNDAFIMRIESAHAPVAVLVFNDQALFNSVEHNVLLLIGELGKRFGEWNLVLLSHRFEHAVEVLSVR